MYAIRSYYDVQEIKRQKIAFETGLRSLIESHLRLLDFDCVAMEQYKIGEFHQNEALPFGPDAEDEEGAADKTGDEA